MKTLEDAREDIKLHINLFLWLMGKSLSSSEIEGFTDQIIFDLIKRFFAEEIDKKTLYKISGRAGSEEIEKKHSRTMQYSNHFRNITNETFKSEYGFERKLIDIPDMENRANRYNGYHLDLLQEKQMEAMESISLLKNITNKRITDVKKVSNYELEKEYEEYIEFFNRKINTSIGAYGSDTDFVLYSILLFTTEVAYCVMSVYSLAERISQYQHSKSKEKFQNDYLTIMEAFNKIIYDENKYVIESNMVLAKLKTIKNITPENLQKSVEHFVSNRLLFSALKRVVLSEQAIELVRKSSNTERREFIEKYYPVHEIVNIDIVWENKKEKNIRDLYKTLVRKTASPKIK